MSEDKNSAYKQAGGHEGNIVFDGNKITKKTKLSEVENYERIFREDPKFQKLIPHFYGATKGEKDCRMTTENLLYGRENASYMDIKLGTSSCTLGSSEEKQQRRLVTDKERCTAEHGYTVVACQLKNPETGEEVEVKDSEGSVIDTGRIHPPSPEASKVWLERLFTQNKEKDVKAVKYLLSQLEIILDYFENDNTYTIRGMSLFIVIDSLKEEYFVKLIDLVSMDPTGECDVGLVKGCQSLMTLLKEMI
mmetsp:Transcript_1594/g.2266  ORF Transcript_1594/g.2266 Transcript_1594/m.2266 type:complete len:249 (+) Transcript_1594:82-828(+)